MHACTQQVSTRRCFRQVYGELRESLPFEAAKTPVATSSSLELIAATAYCWVRRCRRYLMVDAVLACLIVSLLFHVLYDFALYFLVRNRNRHLSPTIRINVRVAVFNLEKKAKFLGFSK